jgi:cold shock CspA family protein
MFYEGKIHYWDEARGFGFANVWGENKEVRGVYIHAQQIRLGLPTIGSRIFCKLAPMPKGPAGHSVVVFPSSSEGNGGAR